MPFLRLIREHSRCHLPDIVTNEYSLGVDTIWQCDICGKEWILIKPFAQDKNLDKAQTRDKWEIC